VQLESANQWHRDATRGRPRCREGRAYPSAGKAESPVSAEEAEHLTSRNRERHGVDRDPIAEPFRQLFDDERRKTRDSLVLANTEVASESA
jgi:hypothetical protein